MAPVSRHMYSRKESFTTSHLERKGSVRSSLPVGSPSSSLPPEHGLAGPLRDPPLGPAVTHLVSATAREARDSVASRALPDHSLPVGKIRRRWSKRNPEPPSRPLPAMLSPPSCGFAGCGVMGIGHSQSFRAKVWDKGQPADFQEFCLQRKTMAQRRDFAFQQTQGLCHMRV